MSFWKKLFGPKAAGEVHLAEKAEKKPAPPAHRGEPVSVAVLGELKADKKPVPPANKGLALRCTGCRQTFRLGEDSVAVSMEFALQLASKAVVFGSGTGPASREDLVSKLKDEPKGALQSALDRGRPSLDLILASLARGEDRTWSCKDCNTVNSYSQSDRNASEPARSDVEPQARKPVPKPAASAGPQTKSILEAVHKGSLEEVADWIKCDPKCVSMRENDYLAATPLHIAATQSQSQIVSTLLTSGADPNAKDGNGWTALHFAAERGNKEIVAILLKHGAINCNNRQCSTPAECAARKGFKEVADLIVSTPKAAPRKSIHEVARDGDLTALDRMLAEDPGLVSSLDEDRATPLHSVGSAAAAESLLKKGANPNATNKHGGTPLHLAAMSGNEGLVSALLAAGANVNAKDKEGWTALKYAEYEGFQHIIQLLRQKGGH